jgi:hypothetical protein
VILTEPLEMRQVSAKLIPALFTQEWRGNHLSLAYGFSECEENKNVKKHDSMLIILKLSSNHQNEND